MSADDPTLGERLAAEYGVPGAPLVEWATAWTTDDGVPVGADSAGNVIDQALTDALIGYGTTAGRGDPWSNVEASTCTAQLAHELAGRIPAVGEPVRLTIGRQLADAMGLDATSRPRFTGEVTGRQLDDEGRLQVQLVGRRARLGRLYIGDEPWPDESDGARVQRVLDLAHAQLSTLQRGVVDVGTVQLLPRDVDRQPALAVLDDVANDSAGQLVERRDGRLTWHDAQHRRNLVPLVELQAGKSVLRGLTWSSDLDGMVNDLELAYGAAEPQDVVRVVDDVQAGATGPGPVAAQMSTRLALADQAADRARLIVGRRSTASWEAPALTVDLTRSVTRAQLVALLGVEHGALLRVTGLPVLSPFTTTRQVVEGYTEQLTRSSWQLQLAVADLSAAGAPVRWADVPAAITWAQLAQLQPAMTWLQAASWQPDPDPTGRWLDQPATLRWSRVDPALTWATYPS